MTANARPTIKNLRWSQWLGIVGLAALFLALRWNSFSAPLDRDEGEYAYSAQLMVQGIAPYQHAYIQKPPGIFYSYAFANLLLPNFYWAPRMLAAVFMALATVLLGFIARLEFGAGVALPVMWLATPMLVLPGLDQVNANVEMFLLLPLLATVTVYSYSRRRGNQHWHWLAAGFLAATTLLYKYTALPVLAFVFAVWLIELWRQTGRISVLLRAVGGALAGGVLAAALGLAYFLVQDGGKHLWECTVVFNRYYAGSDLFGLHYFGVAWKNFWMNWWVLFFLPWAVFWQPARRLWFWLGIFGCAVVSTNESCYSHYYMVMMPFWALLSGLGLRALAVLMARWRPQWPAWVGTAMAAFVVLLLLRSDVPWMLKSSKHFAAEKMAGFPFIEALVVADQVDQRSSPDDFVYVAGSEPEILCYARRFSPTRFVTSYALMDPTPLAPGYQREAIQDLKRNPPRLIVFPASGYSWTQQDKTPPEFSDFLVHFIAQDYQIVGGYVKQGAQPGSWRENLSREEFENSTLWLYQRKVGD